MEAGPEINLQETIMETEETQDQSLKNFTVRVLAQEQIQVQVRDQAQKNTPKKDKGG